MALSTLKLRERRLQPQRNFALLETAIFCAATLAQADCSMHQLGMRPLSPFQCKFVTSGGAQAPSPAATHHLQPSGDAMLRLQIMLSTSYATASRLTQYSARLQRTIHGLEHARIARASSPAAAQLCVSRDSQVLCRQLGAAGLQHASAWYAATEPLSVQFCDIWRCASAISSRNTPSPTLWRCYVALADHAEHILRDSIEANPVLCSLAAHHSWP